jgi:hypothetical protein
MEHKSADLQAELSNCGFTSRSCCGDFEEEKYKKRQISFEVAIGTRMSDLANLIKNKIQNDHKYIRFELKYYSIEEISVNFTTYLREEFIY